VAERTAERAVLEFREEGTSWPFPFLARQDFRLAADFLNIAMEIVNTGARPMPAGIGLHPYFPRTPRCRVEAKVGAMWTADADLLPVALVEPPSDFDPGQGIAPADTALDAVYAGWSGTARITWPEHGAGLAMTAGPPFGFLVVYAPSGKDFFCVEPVSHMTDAFNLAARGRTDTGMIVLPPGQSLTASVRLAVEPATR
jgi:aldose 1-epimerase